MHSPTLVLLALIQWSTASATTPAQSLCSTLAAQVPGKVFESANAAGNNSAAIAEAVGRYWDVANADDVPGCIFLPSSAQDVSHAMKLLKDAPSVPFALKSGGHNFNRGYSSTNGGLLISFRPSMNYTRPSADLKTAEVGPGARWQEVMAVLDRVGRCAVGGRAGDVGVGGYITHGGISYLSSQYGFAADNVESFEVVTANGTILNASRSSHPSLFWALRGGGNLFGVVTKYTLKIHPIGKVWGGPKMYTMDKAPAIFNAITNYIAKFDDSKSKSALIPTVAWIGALNGSSVITIFYFWDGEQVPAGIFDEFDMIEPFADQTSTQSYPSLLNMSGLADFSIRTSDAVASFPNMPARQMVEFLEWHVAEANKASYIQNNSSIGFTLFSMAIQPIPTGLQKQNAIRGPAALTTNPLHGDKVWIEYSLGWQDAVCDQVCPDQLLSMVKTAQLHQQQHYSGIAPTNFVSGDLVSDPYEPLFANDAHAAQPVFESYGAATYARMKRIYAEYDAHNVFLLQTGGFKF